MSPGPAYSWAIRHRTTWSLTWASAVPSSLWVEAGASRPLLECVPGHALGLPLTRSRLCLPLEFGDEALGQHSFVTLGPLSPVTEMPPPSWRNFKGPDGLSCTSGGWHHPPQPCLSTRSSGYAGSPRLLVEPCPLGRPQPGPWALGHWPGGCEEAPWPGLRAHGCCGARLGGSGRGCHEQRCREERPAAVFMRLGLPRRNGAGAQRAWEREDVVSRVSGPGLGRTLCAPPLAGDFWHGLDQDRVQVCLQVRLRAGSRQPWAFCSPLLRGRFPGPLAWPCFG